MPSLLGVGLEGCPLPLGLLVAATMCCYFKQGPCSAIVSSPRRPLRTMRIFSSAENFRRVALRMSRRVLSALPGRRSFLSVIVSLIGAPMNPKVSLTQSVQSVP